MKKVKIGKNAIENLTIGMYEESTIIFREYIQNSADSIDTANALNMFQNEYLEINIDIDSDKRYIKIEDNALGVKSEEAYETLADVADSKKIKGIDKGFRGIGRLGGLAYCEKLVFSTSYYGEPEMSIMTWDAKKLVSMINDKNFHYDAENLLINVIDFETVKCEPEKHFFSVELIKVRKENKDLLDVTKVRDYIGSNAPVAYQTEFIFKTKIYDYANEHDFAIDEYKIFINGEDIFKPYSTRLYEPGKSKGQKKSFDEIGDLEFKQFFNENGELLAWMWYGISRFEKSIPESVNMMRGIRLRSANIQIGDYHTLVKLFKEHRGNSYFIGEIHTVHEELIPNARRDYYNENETRNQLEKELRIYFREELHKLYHHANAVKNAIKHVVALDKLKLELDEKPFINPDQKEKHLEQIERKKNDVSKGIKKIQSVENVAVGSKPTAKVLKLIKEHYGDHRIKKYATIENDPIPETIKENDDKHNETKKSTKSNFLVDELCKLSRKERKLVSRVYAVIHEVLPPDMSEEVIRKVQEELMK